MEALVFVLLHTPTFWHKVQFYLANQCRKTAEWKKSFVFCWLHIIVIDNVAFYS